MVNNNGNPFTKIRLMLLEKYLYGRARSIDRGMRDRKTFIYSMGLYPIDNFVRHVINNVDNIYYNHQDKDECFKLYKVMYTTRELIDETLKYLEEKEDVISIVSNDKRIQNMKKDFPVFLNDIIYFNCRH